MSECWKRNAKWKKTRTFFILFTCMRGNIINIENQQLVMSAESCCRFLKCYGVLELDWGGSFTVVWISWSSFECCLWDVWVLWRAILHYYWYKHSKIHILKHPFSSPGNYLQEVFWEAGTVSTASLLVSEDSGSAKSKNSSF